MKKLNSKKRLLLFGGQFDPVHIEHLQILKATIAELAPDIVKVVPSYAQKAKSMPLAQFATRVDMLKLALYEWQIFAEVDEIERELVDKGLTNGYTFDLLQALQERYPDYTLYFLIGADQFLNFDSWYKPKKITEIATLVVASRMPLQITEEEIVAFQNKYRTTVHLCTYEGREISSTVLQCKLAFAKSTVGEIPTSVIDYLQEHREIYQPKELQMGLEFLMPMRREHSYRVAKMALQVANRYQLDRRQVLYAAALHDTAKHLNSSHPCLQNFQPTDEELTDKSPVWHAFAGAYLAEYVLGIQDRAILNAIAYHTTGRANMTMLEKVIYLADMLEEERDFKNISYLRQLYRNKIDKCLSFALEYSINYLKEKKVNIYRCTQEAWEYYKEYGNA